MNKPETCFRSHHNTVDFNSISNYCCHWSVNKFCCCFVFCFTLNHSIQKQNYPWFLLSISFVAFILLLFHTFCVTEWEFEKELKKKTKKKMFGMLCLFNFNHFHLLSFLSILKRSFFLVIFIFRCGKKCTQRVLTQLNHGWRARYRNLEAKPS